MDEQIARFHGSFQLDDATIPGEITHSKETGKIRLSLTKVFDTYRDLTMECTPVPTDEITTTEEESAWMTSKSEEFTTWRDEHAQKVRLYNWIGFISGTLNDGTFVTLFNCHRVSDKQESKTLTRKLVFSAEYILWGDPTCVMLDETGERVDRKYHKYVCVIENALGWVEASRIRTEKYGQFELRSSIPGKNKFSWKDAQIRFSTQVEPKIWGSYGREKYTLTEHLQFEITAKKPLSAYEFLQIRNKVLAMISFAIQGNVNIIGQYVYNDDDRHIYKTEDGEPLEEFPVDEVPYPITSDEPHRRIWKTNPEDLNFHLNDFKGREMSKLLTTLEPIFSLYTSLYKYSDMPLEMIYLNLIQAVEKFHATFHSYGGSKRKYVERTTKRFQDHPRFEDLLKPLFLSEPQLSEHTDYVILLSRIADLLVDKGNEDDLFYAFYGVDRNFPHKITDTRHYYTHYGEGKQEKIFVGHELYDAIKVLKYVLEYHVCKELGVDISAKIREQVENFLEVKEFNKYMV